MSKIIVSEYVSFGHPDKISDQISDAILDEFLIKDKNVKTGIEVLIKDNVVVLGGEINSTTTVDYDKVVRGVMSKFHFSDKHKLNPSDIKIINLIGKQSPEINGGVVQEDDIIGAGDQGFMVGYASNEAPNCLPLGVYLSKTICQFVSTDISTSIGPDVKSQVIIDYSGEQPILKHILVSTMHTCTLDEIRFLITQIILNNKIGIDKDIFEKYFKDNTDLVIDVNPCGSWEIGGPVSDCGVTGRKIVVDQFGGYCNVGGGGFCFSYDTLVKTENGHKFISDVKIGEKVFTKNEITHEIELKPILNIFEKSVEDSYELLELELENGEIIKITENHEVMLVSGEWVKAKNLKPNDDIFDIR